MIVKIMIYIFRWWVAANGSQNTAIFVGENIITQTKLEVDRLRNVFKFLLGNLPPSLSEDDLLNFQQLLPLDRYILHCLTSHCQQVNECYDQFMYNKVILQTQHFVASLLSSFYFDLVKDRLYCDSRDSLERKSANTVMFHILNNLQASISPILPILCREVSLHSNIPKKESDELSLLYQYSTDPAWFDEELKAQTELLINLKENVKKIINESDDTISRLSTKDLNKLELIFMPLGDETTSVFAKFGCNGLKEIFQVSNVKICHSKTDYTENIDNLVAEGYYTVHEESSVKIKVVQSSYNLCPRCRLFSCNNHSDKDSLCTRCDDVLLRRNNS